MKNYKKNIKGNFMPNFHACCHAERSRSVKKIIPSFIIHNSQFLIGIFTTFLIFNSSFLIAQTLDSLTYKYKANTNHLKEIKDAIGSSISTVDLDNQSSNNYTYDANGQLITDAAEGILKIEWNLAGKVKQVNIEDDNAHAGVDRTIQFYYDAMGNRVKKVETTVSSGSSVTTYYLCNTMGELISIYSDESGTIKRKEIEITDGSDNIEAISALSATEFERNVGFKSYELKDHLDNVRVTISDLKEPNSGLTTFNSQLTTSIDYYSYGMQMPGRDYNSSNYRWGYQRKEKDDELKNITGSSYDFGARQLDPRVGRWLSIDPLETKFPAKSPYNSMGNNPVNRIDPNGMEDVMPLDQALKEHCVLGGGPDMPDRSTPGSQIYSNPELAGMFDQACDMEQAKAVAAPVALVLGGYALVSAGGGYVISGIGSRISAVKNTLTTMYYGGQVGGVTGAVTLGAAKANELGLTDDGLALLEGLAPGYYNPRVALAPPASRFFGTIPKASPGVRMGVDPFLSATQTKSLPGVMDIFVHGTAKTVTIGEREVGADVLAGILKKDPQFIGQPIRLVSCSTGQLENGFAQQLANALGVPVIAPNNIVHIAGSGRLSVSGIMLTGGKIVEAPATATDSFMLFMPQ